MKQFFLRKKKPQSSFIWRLYQKGGYWMGRYKPKNEVSCLACKLFNVRSGLQQAAFQTEWNRCLFMTCFKKLHWLNYFDRDSLKRVDTGWVTVIQK